MFFRYSTLSLSARSLLRLAVARSCLSSASCPMRPLSTLWLSRNISRSDLSCDRKRPSSLSRLACSLAARTMFCSEGFPG